MLGVTGSGPRFWKPEKLLEGKIVMFRLTRSSEFPRCWVIDSPGCSEKNTFPPVTREVTESHSLWIGAPPCLSCVRFVPCCHCLCIRSFVPCHWNAGLLRLFGLKEYGLGTQSLGLNCPLSEVGTPPPHNSGMAYGLETENNNNIKSSMVDAVA